MKKLILLVLSVMAALSINASQITHEQLVKINKFNKDWTNIVAMEAPVAETTKRHSLSESFLCICIVLRLVQPSLNLSTLACCSFVS
jgi:hypothetical protein